METPSRITYRTAGADEPEIDDQVVRKYFDGVGTAATAASFMGHERDMPPAALAYRLACELRIVEPWISASLAGGTVLDLGCGAGNWTAILASRFSKAVAVERSQPMLQAARRVLASHPNVTLIEADIRDPLPVGPFALAFLGGLCMYQSDDTVVDLLTRLRGFLAQGGCAILRESTVRAGTVRATGTYQAVYRSVERYLDLAAGAGFPRDAVDVRRNDGYDAMNIAGEMVLARRRLLPFLPEVSPCLGAITWHAMALAAPISFRLLPWSANRLGIAWPRLSNHFFRLTNQRPSASE